MMLVFPKWRKPKCVNTWAFWDLMLWTASKSSPARLIDSDNIRQIVSTIWVYIQAEQLELFNPNRLPQAPYCTRGKGEAVVIRRLQSALRNPLIQINLPVLTWWLVFDIDHPQAAVMAGRRIATAQLGCSQPVKRPCTHGLRPFYSCKNCWPWHIKALRYFAAVYDAMAVALKADLNYSGLLTKNPTHEKWRTEWVYNALYELSELAEYVDLTQAQKTRWERF